MPLSASASAARVLVFDDDSAIGGMLIRFLQSEPGLVVQSRARSLAEGIAALAARPNLAVLDWMLPDGTCLEFLRAVRALQSPCRVLIFSANTSSVAVRQAIGSGAHGYVERSASYAEFVTALRTVAAGTVFLSEAIEEMMRRPESRPQVHPGLEALTVREREILRLVGEGFASKQIAALYGLSVRTVENHRAAIMRKTGLHSAAQLAVHAVQVGLVAGASALSDPLSRLRRTPVG